MKVYQKLSELNIQTRYLWISVISYLESVDGMFVMLSPKSAALFRQDKFVVSLKKRVLEEAKIRKLRIWRVSRMPSILIFVILILMVFSRIVLNL
ncbi:MAG: hypothetical protein CM15mP88_1490 [Pseudomonadota bacterium]|nr:MAG: hypothetical protein CM15mP88_1490 [Pseudomonadota bacterium]